MRMGSPPQFRSDLYQGTAAYYDRYRVPYPAQLIDELAARASLSGTGSLLDLACGPGRATFALCPHFAEVVAIDREDEAVRYARALASARGADHVRWLTGKAEDLEVGGAFELVTIGDAFHRLDRRRVAGLAAERLQSGGHIALLWTSMPWEGSTPWQKVALEWVMHWMETTGSLRNIPPDLADSLARAPHHTVLADAGFRVIARQEFSASHTWTLESLIGFAHSTSILSRPALGTHLPDFERDLRERLRTVQPDGPFEEVVTFSFDLAVKPW